jgi:hypothetical protein
MQRPLFCPQNSSGPQADRDGLSALTSKPGYSKCRYLHRDIRISLLQTTIASTLQASSLILAHRKIASLGDTLCMDLFWAVSFHIFVGNKGSILLSWPPLQGRQSPDVPNSPPSGEIAEALNYFVFLFELLSGWRLLLSLSVIHVSGTHSTASPPIVDEFQRSRR